MKSTKEFGKKEARVIQVNEGELQKTYFGNCTGERGRHPERPVGSRGRPALPGETL